MLCTRDDGTSQTITLGPVPDSNWGFTYIPIEKDIIELVVGGSLRASFTWKTDAPQPRESGSITITVVGTKVSMPVPSVSPIELGLIPVGEDITVTIPTYEPHNRDWLETLYITHVPPGGGNALIAANGLSSSGEVEAPSMIGRSNSTPLPTVSISTSDRSTTFGGPARSRL